MIKDDHKVIPYDDIPEALAKGDILIDTCDGKALIKTLNVNVTVSDFFSDEKVKSVLSKFDDPVVKSLVQTKIRSCVITDKSTQKQRRQPVTMETIKRILEAFVSI
jgi:hypothetical protein